MKWLLNCTLVSSRSLYLVKKTLEIPWGQHDNYALIDFQTDDEKSTLLSDQIAESIAHLEVQREIRM